MLLIIIAMQCQMFTATADPAPRFTRRLSIIIIIVIIVMIPTGDWHR